MRGTNFSAQINFFPRRPSLVESSSSSFPFYSFIHFHSYMHKSFTALFRQQLLLREIRYFVLKQSWKWNKKICGTSWNMKHAKYHNPINADQIPKLIHSFIPRQCYGNENQLIWDDAEARKNGTYVYATVCVSCGYHFYYAAHNSTTCWAWTSKLSNNKFYLSVHSLTHTHSHSSTIFILNSSRFTLSWKTALHAHHNRNFSSCSSSFFFLLLLLLYIALSL